MMDYEEIAVYSHSSKERLTEGFLLMNAVYQAIQIVIKCMFVELIAGVIAPVSRHAFICFHVALVCLFDPVICICLHVFRFGF